MVDPMPENPQIIFIIGGWPMAYETAKDAWEAYDSAQKAGFLIDLIDIAITCPEDDSAACHVQIKGILTHYKYLELPEPISLEFFEQLLTPA